MGRGEWERICFKHSQRYCSTISFCVQFLGEQPVCWCSCFPNWAHFSLTPTVLGFTKSNVWRRDTGYLNDLTLRNPHLDTLSPNLKIGFCLAVRDKTFYLYNHSILLIFAS